jgi:hypothetical protein
MGLKKFVKENQTMKTIEFELPIYWASAIFNDDLSGLQDNDIKEMDDFFDWAVETYGDIHPADLSEDYHFAKYHDAADFGVLACDVAKYTFLIN